MHAWVFRHLDQLRPIYERDFSAAEDPAGAGPRLAQGTAQRVPGAHDVTLAPMRRPPGLDNSGSDKPLNR